MTEEEKTATLPNDVTDFLEMGQRRTGGYDTLVRQPSFAGGTDEFNDQTRKERKARFKASADMLFSTDVSKLDDAGASALYQSVTEGMFGLPDEDGTVAFGKRASKDPRQNIELLRKFVKGDYALIEDPEYTKWRQMDDEAKFKYALENETTGNKLRSYMKGERGAGFWENIKGGAGMSVVGLPAGAAAFQPDIVRKQNEQIALESARRSNYETLTDEEKAKYRADVVADYEEKLSRRQTLATFLQFAHGLSDRAGYLLAKSFSDGTPDAANIEGLPEDERDRVYAAFSLMRGDQKKGHILGIETDFSDDTAMNRLQMGLYGFQQSVVGLVTDTGEMARDAAMWTYAKLAMDEQERKEFFKGWDAIARAEQAMKQNLPEADSLFGEAFQGVAENFHWFIPYGAIRKGGSLAKGARAAVARAGLQKEVAEGGLTLAKAAAEASRTRWLADVEGAVKAGKGAKRISEFSSAIAMRRQLAAVDQYTAALREIPNVVKAAKWKDAAGAGMWAAGEASAFSAFASEYIANADAAGISREESVLTSAAIGLINAWVERWYVPGLESSLTPTQIKSLTFAAMAQAIKTDGAAGFRKWLANRVSKGVTDGVKVAATEGLVEEPLQQMAIEHGKAFDKLCQELRKDGNATLANEAKALWDSFAATLPNDYATFIDTAADMVPSSLGFGVTTIGNMTRRQHIHNAMTRHANRRAGSTSTMMTAQTMQELQGATDYDVGLVDVIQQAVNVRSAVEKHWQGEEDGGEAENPHRFEEAITAARRAWRDPQTGDAVQEIANAAGVDVKTAEVLAQYLQTEAEATAFSPQARAWTSLNRSLADIDEATIKTVLPGYVEGSFASDPENGIYSGRVRMDDGTEKTIAYRVGDLSAELMDEAQNMAKADSRFGKSFDARHAELGDGVTWASLSDAQRYAEAVRSQASVNGFSTGKSGVFELTDSKGEKVRVNADDIIYLANGRIGDIGYGPAATQGTVRHETFHSLWRFVRGTLADADVQQLAKTLGIDVTKDGWEVTLDERMAHEMERYASGHYVSHAVSSRFDKMLDSWAGKIIDFFGKFGPSDEVTDPKTGKPYQLKGLYDSILRGELGSGTLGVELRKVPAQPATTTSSAPTSSMPVEVTDADRAEAEAKAQEEAAKEEPPVPAAPTSPAPAVTTSTVPVATSESPADAATPNQRYYKVGLPNSNVKLVGRLEVRDVETDIITSTDADYHDRGNQNRDDKSEESRALVEKIGAYPDPLQLGTVQPIASNGIIWILPNGDDIIGNHRANGVRRAYEKGTAGDLEKFVREDAAKRGIEIGADVKKPLMVFVLERIESPDGKADVHEVVRLANESQNRGFNIREQAGNDAKILTDNNLLPRMEFRADGRIDETKSGDAIGKFRQESGAQGLIAEDGSLTEEGQTRIQNAALAALLGGEGNNALLQKIMSNAGRLDMQNEVRALMKMTPELMALAEAKPGYDLRGPLAEALQLFTEWRDKDETARVEKGKTRHDWRETAKDGHRVRGLSWEAFMSQGDMFRQPSDEAKILGDMFAKAEQLRSFDREDAESAAGKKRVIDLISDYLADYIANARAVNTETDDMFGGSPASRADVLAAQRATGGQMRFSVARREYDDVVRRYTNRDGTKKRGWMKAPNGKPTRLTERQWVQVRTPSFKKWFGDWEANALLTAMENLPPIAVTARDGGITVEAAYAAIGDSENAIDGRTVRFVNSSLGKILRHKGYPTERIVHQLGEIFEKSVPIGFSTEKRRDGHKEHRNFVGYHNYVGKISDGGKDYYVRITVQELKTRSKKFNPNEFHSSFVSDVELYSKTDALALDTAKGAGKVGAVGFVDGIISNLLDRRNSASKIADENGEPLVVYRGAEFDPLAQEPGKGVIKPEAYFTADPEYSKRYAGSEGTVRAYYLNIRHPFDIRDPECAKDFESVYPGVKLAKGKSGALDWAEAATVDGEFLKENFGDKYDGIIFDEASDWAMEGNLPKWRGLSYVPLDGGAQVKSATDNNGDFSASPDVRFSIAAQPAGRNKAANVSYPDAGEEISSTRFSIGAKRRDEYARILAKHRPDLRADAVLDELDKYDNPKKEKLALHWLVRGTIWLPNDEGKVDQAIEVAEKAKVDPFKYASPLALIDAHADIHPTEKRIDPSTVPELTDARDEGNGVVSYAVADTREGQAAMRRIIDTHWGEDANPWCLLARTGARKVMTREFRDWLDKNHSEWPLGQSDATIYAWSRDFEKEGGLAYRDATDGELLENAWQFWNNYNALPKRVAFKDGKLLAFMATEGMDKDQAFDDAAYDGGSELARRLPDLYAEYEQWQESEEGQNEGANFYEWLDHEHYDELREFLDNPSEEWWDRQDESHIGHDGLMEIAGAKGGIRYSIGGIYTGSAADYEKPSLHHVGTGEGSQVYGWGLYGSTVRGIAEGYGRGDVFAKKRPTRAGHFEINGKRLPEWVSDRLLEFDEDGSTYFDGGKPDVNFLIKGLKDEGVIHGHKDAAEILKQVEANREGLRFVSETEGNLYEQTFFTNRKPGDESHLLKWYDEISDANWDRVIAQAEKEGLRDKLKGAWWLRFNGDLEHFITDNGNSGDAIYERLSKLLGTPQAASEFLARAGIDGVKYPVDSYGKTLKDGDAAGWNYVSFRDDNISVDHKWTDGQRRYSITTLGKYNTDDLRDLAHRVKDGDSAAIADAGRRLAKILPKNAVLVPMPSRTGEPTTMRALSDAIAANADGATVVDALRSNPHESSYERKKRGDEPEEVEMRRVAEIPKGREVYVVDNVIDTGAMYHAAMRTIHDAHLLALADTDKTPAELRQTIAQNIDHILSRFDAAKGLSKKDIFAKFDNRQLEIGWLPSDLALPDELQVAKRSVMGAEAFILDHIHNKPGHEKQLTADDARRMLANIDPNNEMRVVPQRGSLSLAFIAPNPANGWDCTVIAPHGGALYVFKTMFGQTRKPYQDKSLIRYSVSVRRNEAADRLIRGGLSSIRDFSETPRSISQSGAPAQGGRFSVSAPAVADPDVQVAKESAEQRYSVFAGEKTAAPRLLKPLAEAKAMLGDGEYTDAVRREIYDKTGWWRGTDGKWRVELPNLKPKYFDADKSVDFADSDLLLEKYGWDEYSAYWLRDLVTFPKGLKANTYELGETLVFFVDEEQMKSASGGEDASAATFVRVEQGLFGPQVTCEIHVVDPMVEDRERNGRQRLAQSTLDSITHELQHVIQLREGFAFGGNMTDAGSDRAYGAAAGEVEARNAARRNDPDSHVRPPWETEDVPARYQSVGYSGWEWTDAEGWRPMAETAALSPAAVRPAAEGRRYSVSAPLVAAMQERERRANAPRAPQGDGKSPDAMFSTEAPRSGLVYPQLRSMSDDELIAAAMATRIALGKSDKVSDRSVKINTVQKRMRRLHPDWTDTDIGRESNRIISGARTLGKKIREDLDRGVSDSLVLEHLPDAVREQFGREMREEARKGQRLGVFAQRVKGEIDERQARIVEDAVRNETGFDASAIENYYGINLSETIMHIADNPLTEKDATPGATGEGEGSADEEGSASAEESEEAAVEIDAKVKAVVDDIVSASRDEAGRDVRNREDRRAAAGRDAERSGDEGSASGDSSAGDGDFEGDALAAAVKKASLDLENPRHLARLVAELARRKWIQDHGLAQNAEVWRDLVAVQFLRKTAQSVYAKLVRDLTYSRSRETAMGRIAKLDNVPTVAGLLSEMEFLGALVNAQRIRDKQKSMCEKLDLFLCQKFGAQGRFKPDKEEGKRKVSAEAELRAKYMRHAMWLTPDAAAEEARQLQETLDALSVDFKDAGRDVDQSREFVETIRKLNVLREFGALRYKPVGEIEAAVQWWEDFARGESDNIMREMLDRDIRTGKAAYLLAVAFADPKRKTAREGGKADALNRFITGHMGFISLLQDCMRHASDADAAAAKDIIDYIAREIQKSGDRSEAEKRRHNDAFRSAVESIYGKGFNAVMKDMMAPDERFAKFMGVVGGKRVTPTKGRAMQLLVSLLQEGRKVQVEDEDNPGKTRTVWEGGYHDNIVKNHREGQADEIMKLLTPADMNMLKWLGQWYENNRSDLSQVCHSLFGIGVYAELPNYFPVKMQLATQGLEKGQGVGWTIFPKALTPRVRNERDFDTSADIFSMWAGRMEEAAQWKHHAQLGLELRGIFGQSILREAVRANHGASVDELMQGFITDILAGHGAYDRSTAGVQYFSDQIRGWTALCALGGNIGVMAKQTTSIPAFGFEIGLVNTAKYMVCAFTPEGMAAMGKIWDSEQRRTRWQVGSSEAVRNALNQQGAGALKRMFQASMITNKLGDVVPALVVGQGIYRDCLARGMSEEDAMAETWSIIERTQQSGRMENQTSIQRRNKLGRIMFQFLSTQQQYLQYEVRAIREVIARPDSVKRWGNFGRAIVLAHFILPSFYYWMGQLYKYALGQEPPEDELKDWVISCMLGPLGSLFVAGFCCKYTLERALKGYSIRGGSSMLPMESWLKNQVNDGAKLLEAIFDSDGDTWDNMLDAIGRWMSDSNSTVRDLRKIYRYRIKNEPQKRK